MPRVLNRRRHSSADLGTEPIYVGRPTKWGNPFTHLSGNTRAEFKVATREEAVAAYEEWLLHSPDAAHLRNSIYELEGKDLICWCAPMACHADVLLRLANPMPQE